MTLRRTAALLCFLRLLSTNAFLPSSSKLKFSVGKLVRRSRAMASIQTSSLASQVAAFDISVVGATGFTGRLAARYLLKRSCSLEKNVRWAIVGRSSSKLMRLKAELEDLKASYSKQGIECQMPDVVQADLNCEEDMRRLASNSTVIISTAGPFARYGNLLVKSCVEGGVDYCDITGEADWVSSNVQSYHEKARASKARIVHFCGHDSIPWDLMTLWFAEKLRNEHGEELEEVSFYDDVKATASGGSIETIFDAVRRSHGQATDNNALLWDEEGKPTVGLTPRLTTRPTLTPQGWVGPFLMAAVNARAVSRSAALNGYSSASPLIYSEGRLHPGFSSSLQDTLSLGVLVASFFLPPLRWVLRSYVLPNPGQGPSDEEMNGGYLEVRGTAKGHKGTAFQANIRFNDDPGYRDTARMLVESGVCLLRDRWGQELPFKSKEGGVRTPASCQGMALFDALLDTGTEFSHILVPEVVP